MGGYGGGGRHYSKYTQQVSFREPGRTYRRTDGRRLDGYTISSPCEPNGSGELKMKALECSQDFSHYKSMGIFPDAQGQLTPQSLVRSSRISNSSEMLWMFS